MLKQDGVRSLVRRERLIPQNANPSLSLNDASKQGVQYLGIYFIIYSSFMSAIACNANGKRIGTISLDAFGFPGSVAIRDFFRTPAVLLDKAAKGCNLAHSIVTKVIKPSQDRSNTGENSQGRNDMFCETPYALGIQSESMSTHLHLQLQE